MKRIAITQRVIPAEKGSPKDGLEQDYIEYYEKFGMLLIPIPNVLADVKKYLDELKIEGIILSGGNDINPKLYKGTPESDAKYADERDSTERKILEYAIQNKIPVLCECRGCQFMNVYFGGKLKTVNHVVQKHSVKLISGKKINFKNEKTETSSYHKYGFTKKEIAKEIKIFAEAEDGVIEGIYHPKLPVAGIMWHPERKAPDNSFNTGLVNAFINRKWFWK